MDASNGEVKAKLARYLAVLSIQGRGYLIFGVDYTTRKSQDASPFDLKSESEDVITDIIRSYLDPPFQVRVRLVEVAATSVPLRSFPRTEQASSWPGQKPVHRCAKG
jgi:hypothetical protein